jgi:putative hydrolase of the HAD superfamily
MANASSPTIELVAFDGDDTLWHNEHAMAEVETRFHALMTTYRDVDPQDLLSALLEVERRNLPIFGYGVKSFTLSMIEAAVEFTDQRLAAGDVLRILGWAKELLNRPVELIDGAHDTVEKVADQYRVVLITKGDLLDQRRKIVASGLEDAFDRIDIVSEKDPAAYAAVLEAEGVAPERFVMIGNSWPSDIAPVLELGGHAIWVPYHVTWGHEQVTQSGAASGRSVEVDSIADAPAVIDGWRAQPS